MGSQQKKCASASFLTIFISRYISMLKYLQETIEGFKFFLEIAQQQIWKFQQQYADACLDVYVYFAFILDVFIFVLNICLLFAHICIFKGRTCFLCMPNIITETSIFSSIGEKKVSWETETLILLKKLINVR